MKHIIDTDELEKLTKLTKDEYVRMDDLRALIASSPQADGMVLVEYSKLKQLFESVNGDYYQGQDWERATIKAMLSAYKPQADDVPPDVYDIVVNTGDGIYHTAEVVHFQQSGSKRMIQVRLGEPQADDVRKDAERMDYLCNPDKTYRVLVQSQPSGNYVFDSCIVTNLREAIDKARE